MSAFDLWPFENVRSVARRGDLEVLEGTSPDGLPVTITRVAPAAAQDSATRRRFRDAVEAATRQAGPDDPPIMWADTSTLVPWAATYDDAGRRGADVIGGIFESGAGAATSEPSGPGQSVHHTTSFGEKSVPALDEFDSVAPAGRDTGPGVPPPPGYGPVHHPSDPGRGPAGPPPLPGQPPPAPSPGGPGRGPLYVSLGVAGIVVVALLGTLISFGLTRDRDTAGEPGSTLSASTSIPATAPSTQFSTGTASPSATLGGSGTPTGSPSQERPKLKNRKAIAVYGSTWKSSDKTFTMAFTHLGWAFRAPSDWDCLVTKNSPSKKQINCTKLGAPDDSSRRVLIVDRLCSGDSCSAYERKRAETDIWGKRPKMKKKDSTTKFLAGTFTNTQNKKKYFGYYMGHYYKNSSGKLNRHVLVYGDGPVGSIGTQVQKTINDIRTQAG